MNRYYLAQMSLPYEVIDIILLFCRLRDRYRCSIMNTRFKFSSKDWQRYSRLYRVNSLDNRESVRSLLCREYKGQVSVSRRLNILWSNHLCVPLVVWSPWTLQKCCRKTTKKMVFHFRQLHFINFVRNLANLHNIRPSCLRHVCHYESVATTIWLNNTKRMEMYIWKGPHKQRRFCLENTLNKMFCRARALLEFRISSDQCLILKVRKLEFLV